MGSFTSEDTVKNAHPQGLDGLLAERDKAFGIDYKVKAEKRKDIEPPNLSPGKSFGACLRICELLTIVTDADAMWKNK
jgi:hypothetical protein